MKKKYVAPKSEYIRFDVEDVLTKRLPLKNYADVETDGSLSSDQGEGPGYGGGLD